MVVVVVVVVVDVVVVGIVVVVIGCNKKLKISFLFYRLLLTKYFSKSSYFLGGLYCSSIYHREIVIVMKIYSKHFM